MESAVSKQIRERKKNWDMPGLPGKEKRQYEVENDSLYGL